ncbi:MAG: hypothetical protein ACYDAB_16210 [bacterium]
MTLERRRGPLHSPRIIVARHRADLGHALSRDFEQHRGAVRRVGREIHAQRVDLKRNRIERTRWRRSAAERTGAERERHHKE